MYFKKVALLSGLTLLADSIVVPAGSSVNRHRTSAQDKVSAQDKGWHDVDGDGGWNAATSIAARRWRVLGRRDAIATAAIRSGVIGEAWKKCSNLEIEVIDLAPASRMFYKRAWFSILNDDRTC